MTKTHMITDPIAISIAQMITGLRTKFEEAEKELQDRFQKEAEDLAASFNAQKDTLWNDLTEKAFIPPLDKKTGFGYEMDMDYAEELGMVFLRETNFEVDDCDCVVCQARRGETDLGEMLSGALGGN